MNGKCWHCDATDHDTGACPLRRRPKGYVTTAGVDVQRDGIEVGLGTAVRCRRSLREWLADQWTRFEVWRFVRASVPVGVWRSCGHREETRLLLKGLSDRLAVYRSTPCAECGFYAAMAELRDKGRG